MTIDPATYEFYQKQAPHYTLSFAMAQHRHLDPFLDRLPEGARILELGCGGGQDTARIVKRGFSVDATDGVPAMVAKANERFGVGARVMRFDELEADQKYNAVWAHACLLHCPRDALFDVLSRIFAALKPGGLHFANYKLGDGEGRDLLGRLHNFPDARWLRDAYGAAGFVVVDEEIYAGKGADGTQRDWIALTVQRPA